jgi:hypothetical protein
MDIEKPTLKAQEKSQEKLPEKIPDEFPNEEVLEEIISLLKDVEINLTIKDKISAKEEFVKAEQIYKTLSKTDQERINENYKKIKKKIKPFFW